MIRYTKVKVFFPVSVSWGFDSTRCFHRKSSATVVKQHFTVKFLSFLCFTSSCPPLCFKDSFKLWDLGRFQLLLVRHFPRGKGRPSKSPIPTVRTCLRVPLHREVEMGLNFDVYLGKKKFFFPSWSSLLITAIKRAILGRLINPQPFALMAVLRRNSRLLLLY